MTDSKTPRVAIVGAGISGLLLAERLLQQGLTATVFDKGRGVGGRMSTRRSDMGLAFDHGAQYFTARDPRFQSRVNAWIDEGVVAEWTGRIGVLRGGALLPSEKRTTRYVGTPGMNAICRRLAAGVDIRSGVAIANADRDGNGWRLTDTGGESHGGFDCFVTSAPAPQSAGLLQAAPELAARAAGVTMTGCWAAMVAFDEPLDLEFNGAFVEDSPLSWIARNSTKPGRPDGEAWVLHGSPDWSEANLERDADAALAELLAAFWQATGAAPRTPRHAAAHRWRYALPPEPLEDVCLFDADLRIGACGDWCGGPRVEGAALSGWALARAILESL